jgi:hypothetical protein
VAQILVWMPTHLLGLTAWLLARLPICILALPVTVARFAAVMEATTQSLTTDLAAANVLQPAWLILERMLPTHATLLDQEWALRARLVILMAVVRDLLMSTRLRPGAWESTRRRFRTARKRWLKDGASTMAADLLEDGFPAASTSTLVAKFCAEVLTALQQSATLPCANVLSLEAVVQSRHCGAQRSLLLLRALPLSRLLLTCAAAFIASMAATIQRHTAHAHTLRLLDMALVADRPGCRPAASALDVDDLTARRTVTCMTYRCAFVTTR